jgi:hypothetical protein
MFAIVAAAALLAVAAAFAAVCRAGLGLVTRRLPDAAWAGSRHPLEAAPALVELLVQPSSLE